MLDENSNMTRWFCLITIWDGSNQFFILFSYWHWKPYKYAETGLTIDIYTVYSHSQIYKWLKYIVIYIYTLYSCLIFLYFIVLRGHFLILVDVPPFSQDIFLSRHFSALLLDLCLQRPCQLLNGPTVPHARAKVASLQRSNLLTLKINLGTLNCIFLPRWSEFSGFLKLSSLTHL